MLYHIPFCQNENKMNMTDQKTVISAEALSVTLSDKPVLNNLDFQIQSGDIFALLGGNGAGKSTTLKTFLGLIAPTSG